ncbi:unnamed protein product, partial [Sphagnum tenellum]
METRSHIQSKKRVQPDTSPKSVADVEKLSKREKVKPKKLAQRVGHGVAKVISAPAKGFQILSEGAENIAAANSANPQLVRAHFIKERAEKKAAKAQKKAQKSAKALKPSAVEPRQVVDSSSQTDSDTEDENTNTAKVPWSDEVDAEESGRIIPILLIEPIEAMAAAMEVVEVAEHDPTLNKVRELQQKLAGGDTLSPHDFQVMMLEMYEKILTQKDEKIKKLEKDNADNMVRIENLEREVDYLKKEKLRDDVEDAKHGVILRGVGNLGGERGEFANDVKEFGHRLLAKLEVDSAVSVSCRRLPASKLMVEKARSQGRSVRAPILMKFGSVAGKYEMFKALRNLNKIEESNGWRFDHEIPYALKGRWSILEAEAYKIRKDQPGTKTRLVWKGIDLELHAKKDREQGFNK